MAVTKKKIEENQGLIKELDSNSLELILDIVQSDIYNKPIDSSVRETFSNAFDAIKEREIAKKILKGESKEEDFFVERDDSPELKASKFNRGYYDLKYLGNEEKVIIRYTEGEEKDNIEFEDFGVGLSNGRLEGFFKPGFSSKRLSKNLLGRFGNGNKSPLATNIPFYVMETWYNGYYTKFMIYEKYYKCVNPVQDKVTILKGKKRIDGKIVDAEEKVNWSKTNRKNGVKISWEIKKHNRRNFQKAIEHQLMYFKDSLEYKRFGEISEEWVNMDIFPNVLFENEYLVITDNNVYNEPHILINGVVYGLVDWAEVGLNRKFGSIGLKANASDIDVNASRESVKWTDKTKKYLQSVITKASDLAGEIVKKELEGIENPFQKISMAYSRRSDNRVFNLLKTFSGKINLDFKINPKDYGIEGLDNISALELINEFTFNVNLLGVYVDKINSTILKDINSINWDIAYYVEQNENLTNLEVAYLASLKSQTLHIINLTEPKLKLISIEEFKKGLKLGVRDVKKLYKDYIKQQERVYKIKQLIVAIIKKYATYAKDIDKDDLQEFKERIRLKKVIPIKKNSEEAIYLDKVTEQEIQANKRKELLKSKAVIPYKEVIVNIKIFDGFYNFHSWDDRKFKRIGEIPVRKLLESSVTYVYSGYEEEDLLTLAAFMQTMYVNYNSSLRNKYKFVLVSKQNLAYLQKNQFENTQYVKGYMKKTEDNKIVLGEAMKKFNTSIKILEEFGEDKLLNLVYFLNQQVIQREISPESATRIYDLKEFVRKYPLMTNKESEFRSFYAVLSEYISDKDFVKEYLETAEELIKLQDEGGKIEVEAYDKEFFEDVVKAWRENKDKLVVLGIKYAIEYTFQNELREELNSIVDKSSINI